MALGLAVNARGADHNRSGAYEADLSGRARPARTAATPHVRGAIETEDRAAIMDSLILCKFLRGVFADPMTEWARLLNTVTGWDIDADELATTARRIVMAKRLFNLREGWTRDGGLAAASGSCPSRSQLDSGRAAALTPERSGVDDRRVLPGPRAEAHAGCRRPSCSDELDLDARSGRSGQIGASEGRLRPDGDRFSRPSRPRSPRTSACGSTGGRSPSREGHDDPRGRRRSSGSDPGALPRRALRPRRGVPDVRGRRRRHAPTPRPACGPARRAWRSPPPSETLERHRATLTELLLSDQPDPAEDPKETTTGDNELLVLVRQYGVEKDEERLPQGEGRGIDDSNPVIAVNHDACILCDRCVRACDDIQGNDVIGRSGKGYATRIAFDLNDPMGDSSCVTCGECVAACPTGALTNKPLHDVPIRPRSELRQVDTVCPYCGVGCALTYHVDDERQAIAFAEGRAAARLQGPAVRQGPLRLGLRPLPAAADHAADPPRGRLPEGAALRRCEGRRTRAAQARRPGRLRRGDAPLPRGQLGGGARPDRHPAGRRSATNTVRARSPASARRSAQTKRPTCSRS